MDTNQALNRAVRSFMGDLEGIIMTIHDEEESTGDWMIKYELEERVKHFITCEELGYPQSEALYGSIQEWEESKGLSWVKYISEKM